MLSDRLHNQRYISAMLYANDLTVREARQKYFEISGFDEKTYTDPWIKLPILGFTVYLPNLKPRREAVPLHDIDHVLTEYKTDWPGEWQISAYEIGTGCGKYWAGWIINLQLLLYAGFIAPKMCLRAFARGRRSKGIFAYSSYEPLLSERLGDLRQLTTAPADSVQIKFGDVVLFYFYVTAFLAIHVLPIGLLALAVSKFL